MSNKKSILICCDWFYPAYKAGGPITSVKNFVDHLENDFNIFILTSAYDLGPQQVVPAGKTNHWVEYKQSQVQYLDKKHQSRGHLQNAINDIKPDFIYLNSFFSKTFTIKILKCKKPEHSKIILAPRGMLGTHSLSIKSYKKKAFIGVSKFIGLYEGLTWHATSKKEADEISKNYKPHLNIVTVANFTAKITNTLNDKPFNAQELNLLFVGRISPIKNLDFLLTILSKLPASFQDKIKLTIVGPKEDASYYNTCKKIAENLQLKLLTWLFEQEPEKLADLYSNANYYISTSHHENFGHTIAEALSYGCVCVVSTGTPWSKLEGDNCGYTLNLKNESEWISTLKELTHTPQQEYFEKSRNAIHHIKQKTADLSKEYKEKLLVDE